MFGRRLPPDLEAPYEAFLRVLELVEAAKESLVSVVPSARRPGRPVADGLAEYEDGLRSARAAMPAWRSEAVLDLWEACGSGLDRAAEQARLFRLEGAELPFDALMFALQDLMAPLDAFEEAAVRFRRLRRSGRRGAPRRA